MYRQALQSIGWLPAYLGLSPWQLAYVLHRDKRRTNHSGRRAGKSFASVAWLVGEWESRPGQTSLFGAPSEGQAVSIAWETMRAMNDRHGWQANPNSQLGVWTFPNGFVLAFVGAKDRVAANRLRGWPRIWRVVLDEAASFTDEMLCYLVESVLEPVLMDTNGDLAVTGTPSLRGCGYYDQLMDDWGCDWRWDARDNPHLSVPAEQYFKETLRRHGWEWDHPTFQCDYLGMRLRSTDALVYPLTRTPDLLYEPAPSPDNYTAIGVDVGWNDGMGFTALRTRAPHPGVHVLEAHSEAHMSYSRILGRVQQMYEAHRASVVLVDTFGGGARTIAESLARETRLPVQAAKLNVTERLEYARGLCQACTLRFSRSGQPLIDEMRALPFNPERTLHREGYYDECASAMLRALTAPGLVSTLSEPEPTNVSRIEAYRAELLARRLASS